MSESALERQVGGTHYKALGIQPVEFATINRYDPSAFSTLKYVTRHGSKHGAEDLRKGSHFVSLRLELMRGNPELITMRALDVISVETYILANGIPPAEASILRDLHFWCLRLSPLVPDRTTANHLIQKIDLLINSRYAKTGAPE